MYIIHHGSTERSREGFQQDISFIKIGGENAKIKVE